MTNQFESRAFERFSMIVNGPALFNAIVTGSELGIFNLLSSTGGASFERIQAHAGVKSSKLRILMQALCATELIEKRNDIYRNSGLADDFFGSTEADSWHHILLGWQRIYYPAFLQMTEAIRTGTNTALSSYPGQGNTLYQRLGTDPGLEQIFHKAMAAFTLRSMDGLLQNADFGSVNNLLDVGGGDGATASAIADHFKHVEITIFDLPSVATLAAQRAVSNSGKRIRLQAGDIFADEFPAHADSILFSHVLEVFEEKQICTLLHKAFRALPSGGRVLIYGFNVSDDETEGVYSARLSLYLNVLASGQGMAYPARDYEAWLKSAGFSDVTTITDLPFEHGLTIGVKRQD